MGQSYVFMKLRVGNKADFFDQWNQIRTGVIYFQQNGNGAICTQPFYFTDKTNKETFRELYVSNQILVPVGIFDEVEIIEEKVELTTN